MRFLGKNSWIDQNSLTWEYWNQVKEKENMWHGFQGWSKRVHEELG